MIARKKACDECPFRKNSLAGWLATYTPESLHQLIVSEHPFPCHKTHKETLSLDEAAEHPLCAGGLAYMRKCGKMPRDAEHTKLMREVDQETMDNTLSMGEFLEHHRIPEQDE